MNKLDGLLRQVADEQDALRGRDDLPARVASRFQNGAPRLRGRHGWVWAVAAAALAFGAVFVGLEVARERTTLAVSVGDAGGAPLLGAWLGAPDASSLPLEFSDGSKYVVNSHRAARQIWMAAERVAWHFDWQPESQTWVATKNGAELWATLSHVLSQKLAQPVSLSREKA